MLSLSGLAATYEKVHHFVSDVEYNIHSKQRQDNVFLFKDQNYEAIKPFLQQGRYAFRDLGLSLTDDDDIHWFPIERPRNALLEPGIQIEDVRPTFFADSFENVTRYTYKPGRYSGHTFISAVACVAQHACLLQRIVPFRFEQNCCDVYELPPNLQHECEEDGFDEGSLYDEHDVRPFDEAQEEGGQLSSYQNQDYGDEEGNDRFDDADEGEANWGIFNKSYKEKNRKSKKIGLWDSDTYCSSGGEQDEKIYYHHRESDCDEFVSQTPSPVPSAMEPAGPPIVNRYAGIFRFRFWQNGQWTEVIVDELLPYSNENNESLSLGAVDMLGRPVRDLWLALMEKAYAKLMGRYECLSDSSGGCIEDFLTELSGGLCETIHLRTSQHRSDLGMQASLGHRMRTEMYCGRRKKLIGGKIPGYYSILCAMDEPHNPKQEGQLNDHGLVYGRVYPVTDVREISFAAVEAWSPNNHSLLMVRLRDPFGPAQWNGSFSRGSPEWLAISPIERIRIGLVCETESDFWMPIDTFCARFSQVTFCRIVNHRLLSMRRTYYDNVVEGSWRSAARMAGGSFENNRETFLRNPQYMFRIEPHHTHVMISLSQSLIRQDPSQERHSIGFTILHVEENRIYRVHHVPTPESGYSPIVWTTQYRHTGPVFVRLLLYHGRYVIIPTTIEANKNGNFLLRLISPHQCFLRLLNQDIPAQHLIMPYPTCVTRIRVIRASSLQRLDRPTGTINAYCMIWCERHWVRTKTLWHNTDPEWNQSAVFYRRWSATLCVKVVIWHQAPKYWRDQYLGKHIFQAYEETGRPITVSLYGRRRWENNQPRSGVLTVEITSSADVGAL